MPVMTAAVALSGGVDSSVSALLLRESGYRIIGIYMRLWDSEHSLQQQNQAEHICHILNISSHIADLLREYEHHVVNYFWQEYQQGRTPNPCIACNQYIKFGFLLQKALSLGADYLATGHYARIEHSEDSYLLLKAEDNSKDQSYFLYTLSQEKLRHILFPIGSYTRAMVNQIAKHEGLPPLSRPSQDICFISHKNYHSFLSQYFSVTPGDITDTRGRILGHHRGIAFYTIGQRHGLGLSCGKPLYVIRIEPEHNRVVLGSENELYSQRVIARDLKWIGGEAPPEPIAVTAKIRYKSKEAAATLSPEEGYAGIWFTQPQRAVTPGQAIVFYKGNEVLGGGTIESSQPMTLDDEKKEYITAA